MSLISLSFPSSYFVTDKQNRVLSCFPAMPLTSLPFPLSPIRNPKTPFHLLPSKTLFKCFCSSTTHPLPPLSPDKWEPFLKKKVVMRVGYVGTEFRGSFFLQLSLFIFVEIFDQLICVCVFIYRSANSTE
jgi:hypothetical protein